jgi:hypothetical protein
LFVQIPASLLTGAGIGLNLAMYCMRKRDAKFWSVISGPYLVAGVQRFLSGLLLLVVNFQYSWIYYLVSYAILISHGIYLRRRYNALPDSFLIFDEEYAKNQFVLDEFSLEA